ncbi:hypothetical protein ACH5RR_028910 [Cinchona calisaya]|uniref:LysM domain-containing protein n=1 Tax=Cinchona calisaya TaxID=153742 RepID=A0ABD2YRX0_9GENT
MANIKASVFLNFALILSFLLIISVTENRSLAAGSEQNSVLICDKIYGAQNGDTCFSIAQKFNVTTEFFSSLNPNLNCTNVFVGEWLCVDGLAA